MLQKLISNLDIVDAQILEFKRDLDKGIIRDLQGLDDAILYICNNVASLDDDEYSILKPKFVTTYENVKVLKDMINEELNTTSQSLSALNATQDANAKYSKAANDN
jgi:hypothetical protein